MSTFHGVYTALVTPFDVSGEIDWPAYRHLLQLQKKAKVAGVIPCGTTGESPTLTHEEKQHLIRTTLEELAGSTIQVIAGTGSNSTRETIELSRWASQLRVSAKGNKKSVAGLLVVTPYYNKPTQSGLIEHFHAVAEASSAPILLYNVPSRTGVSLSPETVAHLAKHPRITAIKEATGNLAFASEVVDQLKSKNQKLVLLSGDDATYLPFLSIGGSGVISVTSNLLPAEMVALQDAFDSGNFNKAKSLHQKLYPLFRDLFVESNPAPVKYAMAKQGLCLDICRLPLTQLSDKSRNLLDGSLDSLFGKKSSRQNSKNSAGKSKKKGVTS